MTTQAAPFTRRPIVPEDLRTPPGRALTRAAFAIARNACHDEGNFPGAATIAERTWPHDRQVLGILRAASAPATTGSSSWAGNLAPTLVADFVGSLAPESAAARLIAAGMRVDLTGAMQINVPHRVRLAGK